MNVNNKWTTTKGTTAILSAAVVIGAAMVLVFSLSQEAQALTQSQRDRLADRLDALADRAEAKGFADQAAQLRALADRIRGGGGGCTGCG